ncbi:unnamed protein product [Somion occarium]|uniref:Uncharacterized protein n=1 Tax=Somion occarium TaxID=3059160 RepID=A0ABP1CY39_9APHY
MNNFSLCDGKVQTLRRLNHTSLVPLYASRTLCIDTSHLILYCSPLPSLRHCVGLRLLLYLGFSLTYILNIIGRILLDMQSLARYLIVQ